MTDNPKTNPMLKLRPKDKSLICQLAEEHFSTPIAIWAYGSRVDGTAHDGSDLDLVIIDEVPLRWEEFINFREALRHSNLPILLDLQIWSKIPPSFRQNIQAQHVVLYTHQTEPKSQEQASA